MYLTPNADPSSSACYFAETGPNDKVFSTCKRSLLNMPLALYQRECRILSYNN